MSHDAWHAHQSTHVHGTQSDGLVRTTTRHSSWICIWILDTEQVQTAARALPLDASCEFLFPSLTEEGFEWVRPRLARRTCWFILQAKVLVFQWLALVNLRQMRLWASFRHFSPYRGAVFLLLLCARCPLSKDFAVLRAIGAKEVSPQLDAVFAETETWAVLQERWRMKAAIEVTTSSHFPFSTSLPCVVQARPITPGNGEADDFW